MIIIIYDYNNSDNDDYKDRIIPVLKIRFADYMQYKMAVFILIKFWVLCIMYVKSESKKIVFVHPVSINGTNF